MILFRIFWIFYFGSQKLLSVPISGASIQRTDASFAKNKSVFQGVNLFSVIFRESSKHKGWSKSYVRLRNARLTGAVLYKTIHQTFPYQNFDLNDKK